MTATVPHKFVRRSLAMLLLAWVSCGSFAPAESPEDAAFELLRSGSMDVRTLTEVLPQMANAERRPQIRAAILDAASPPTAELVSLLEFPVLAVRLGALELLEEMAGGDFSYNPWLPAESPENLAPLERWKAWAGEKREGTSKGNIFSDDQRRGYLRDLLGEDADKASRARRMLEAEGMAAIGFLETFLAENPALPTGNRARVREAQYQIALTRQLGDQAAVVARQLAFGSRDQLLSALATVRGAGMFAIPILSDFIHHPDSLVRETAIDSLLVSARQDAVPIIAPILTEEKDVNVIHGALRRLKDIRSEETAKLVATFLTHPDEDLLVSAIQTSLTLSGSDDRYNFGSSKPKTSAAPDEAVVACLKDPRWRVRAVALEYVAKRKIASAKEDVLVLIDDPDSFVRYAAIGACVALGAKEALPKLRQMIMDDAGNAAAVFQGYAEMGSSPDEEMLARIDSYPPEARMAVVRAAYSQSSLNSLLLRYVNDPDLDVSCAALRFIVSDDDRMKDGKFASAVVLALRENKPEKTAAILERLELPGDHSDNYRRMAMLSMLRGSPSTEPEGPTILDPLYAAFAAPEGTASPLESKIPKVNDATGEIIKELGKLCEPGVPAALRLSAALHLAKIGNPGGLATLRTDLKSLTTAQKINTCEALSSNLNKESADFIRGMLADPVSEVRSAAAECAFNDQSSATMVRLVLDELMREGTLLQPEEVYGYRFEYAARENPAFRPWCVKVLNDTASPVPRVILASIASRYNPNAEMIEALRKRAASDVPLVRRAAWHSLLTARPGDISASAKAIAEDPEAFVREVLPNRVTRANYSWQHRFSDASETRDNHYDHNERKIRIDEAARAVLLRMAEADPSPLVRFESGFAVLQQGGTIDINAFVQLLPKLSKESNAGYRIGAWLEQNASRATPALRPLLGAIDTSRINADKMKILKARLQPEKESKGLLTFASLATMDGDGKPADGPLLAGEDTAAEAAERTSLDVVFFYKPGCAECNRVREYLQSMKADFPLLKVAEHNINLAEGLPFNQSLCAWFEAPSTRYGVAPAVFTQAGFVIGPDISPTTLGALFGRTMKEPQDDTWMEVTDTRRAEAEVKVEQHYEQSVTLPVVLIGGLLDGINPCAFATIIFFLSYLQIARRSPREMLMVGAAFILAVFLAYLAAGLLLYQILDALTERIAGVQKWMNLVFGGLALVAAWLSLRDALRARAGRMDEMTLQLPGMLKDRIRGVIRSGARARRFVIAAFLSGIVISFLELACTGQVYAPIVYQIQKGNLNAVLWLVIYNLAFVTPLIIIFLLAYGGLRSETLISFQKRHTFAVKLGLALLFLGLALLIFFGGSLLTKH